MFTHQMILTKTKQKHGITSLKETPLDIWNLSNLHRKKIFSTLLKLSNKIGNAWFVCFHLPITTGQHECVKNLFYFLNQA